MNTSTQHTRFGLIGTKRSSLLATSASLIAVLAAAPLGAQTTINAGDNVTVASAADGETISVAAGVSRAVDGAPVVVIATNDVTLDNAGTLATPSVTQTVQVNQGTTGAIINNAATGRLEAASRVVNFYGTDAALNNDGVILGTGNSLQGDILSGVAVTTAASSDTAISGTRTLNGSLTHNGTLAFTLGVDSLAIGGDTVLVADSVINVATDPISQADIGTTFDVLTETGAFTNNGTTVNVADADFLIDYDVAFGSV